MKFYDALQLDPGGLKAAIRQAETKKERNFLRSAMLIRAILLVIFCVVLIAPIAPVFGPENNAVGVALVCILLSVRFVDFGYRVGDSLVNLALSFFLLWMAPMVAGGLHPLAAAPIHFAALLAIFLMTSQHPEYGNGGLYAFSYIFLSGNPVEGDLFWKRGALLLVGFLICGLVFYAKHRKKHETVGFWDLLRKFRFSDRACQWMVQYALGVSLLMTVGGLLRLERLMWAGFACASLLGCYCSAEEASAKVGERFGQRILGAVAGSALFAVIYLTVPEHLHGLLGPVGGIFLGFCTEYRFKTALNCLGALLLATGLYGLTGSLLLRIVNNLLGAAFGCGFSLLFTKLAVSRTPAAAKSVS